ncbi:hypothetical protein B0H19DRAFT_330921 [Mycena capillaripes]|nr:hypothetical protein B0H19DRAFT_330921 [Mycena capillaripes]
MMADSYEHGRVVWKENKARCAMTGEAESNDLPCGPNSAQKKVESWLIDAGLLAPDDDDDDDESDDTESDDEQATPPASPSPSTPDSPYRLPWHRRLELVLPNNKGSAPKSVSEPALHGPSPRSPLSPVKLWSAVQRGASSMPKLRLKPEHAVPPPPVVTPPSHPVASPKRKKCRSLDSAPVAGTPSADPYDTLLATAFKRAAMLRTITTDDVEAILRRHRNPLPKSHPDASWYIPRTSLRLPCNGFPLHRNRNPARTSTIPRRTAGHPLHHPLLPPLLPSSSPQAWRARNRMHGGTTFSCSCSSGTSSSSASPPMSSCGWFSGRWWVSSLSIVRSCWYRCYGSRLLELN